MAVYNAFLFHQATVSRLKILIFIVNFNLFCLHVLVVLKASGNDCMW